MAALTSEPEAASYALPSVLNGNYSWASQPFQQDNLWSDGPVQYAVWVDDNKKARLARRIHTQAWESSIDLSGVTGTALSAAFTDDSHNVICVATDERGYVHVSGNMHGAQPPGTGAEPLKYMRTTQPGFLTSWTTGMVGTQEGDVTYPQFFKARNGKLHFMYRDGLSSNGDHYINAFNSATRTWSRVCKLFDGEGTRNAYPQHVAVDRTTGRWHVMWTWREGVIGAEENEDICYAYTDNDGVTWRKTDGTAYTLPITASTAEVIFDIAAGPILNNGGLEVDASGRPHAAIMIMDSNSRYQVNHIYHDGSAWVKTQVSNFSASSGRRPAVACLSNGRVFILYCTGTESGYLKMYEVTNPASVATTTLYATDLLTFEPIIDTQALYQRDRIFVLGCKERSAGSQLGDPADLGAQASVPVLAIRP